MLRLKKGVVIARLTEDDLQEILNEVFKAGEKNQLEMGRPYTDRNYYHRRKASLNEEEPIVEQYLERD